VLVPTVTNTFASSATEIVQGIVVLEVTHAAVAEKLTLGKFFESAYFPHLRLNHKSAAEISRALSVAFKPIFNTPVEEVSPVYVEKWREQRHDAGLKYASINRTTAYLKAALNWAFRNGIIDKNPIARISPLKERDSKTVIRYLDRDERERLEAALIEREKQKRSHGQCPDGEFADYLRPAVLLSLATGIRQGALFALTWGDIDFGAQTVTLRGDDAKNSKTVTLPVCDDAVDILSSWRGQSQDASDGAFVFPSTKKPGCKITEIKTAWRALLKAADIKNFRWHDLRHTFASSLVQSGVDLNTVRELMTHSDMKMTMRYAHLAPENKLRAVQALNRRAKGEKIIGRIPKASAS
jgi:integrase